MSEKTMSARQEIEELLAFHANGSLDADEQARVEHALADDAELRDEARLLEALREGVKTADASEYTPGELGLKRLQRQIAAESARERRAPRDSERWWRPVAIAAALVVVVQTGFMTQLWQAPEDGYVPLSGESVGAVIAVSFTPDATEAQIRDAVLAVDGEIVGGPGALGIYRVQVDAEAEDAIAEAAARLEALEGIVSEATPQ